MTDDILTSYGSVTPDPFVPWMLIVNNPLGPGQLTATNRPLWQPWSEEAPWPCNKRDLGRILDDER